MPTLPTPHVTPSEPAAGDTGPALAQLLASHMFSTSPRLHRLLRFLIEKYQAGAVRDMNEFTIGIEVFDRLPAAYSPGDDPVVRVQVGRLRNRLRQYYASEGRDAAAQFTIPKGSYRPLLQRAPAGLAAAPALPLLALAPLACIVHDTERAAFAQGMNEELGFHLLQEFGDRVLLAAPPAGGGGASPSYVIGGSVRIDDHLARASVRLVDAAAGRVAWSGQFDGRAASAILLQEELALSIRGALRQFFAMASPGDATCSG